MSHLVTFTEEILNGKLHFLRSVCSSDMETIIDLGDQWIRNILSRIEAKQEKFKKDISWLFNDNHRERLLLHSI